MRFYGRLFLSLVFFFQTAQAANGTNSDIDVICKTSNDAIIHRTHLNWIPSYFAKVYPVKNLATLMFGGQNWIINLDTGASNQLYGDIDPVPTPDEKFLVTIKSDENLYWTETQDVFGWWNSTDFPPKQGADNFTLSYAYESVGLRGRDSSNQGTFYRLLTDNDAGAVYFKDVYMGDSAPSDYPKKIEYNWVQLCQNIGATLKLPIISKDGSKMSAYNISKNRTQIFKINNDGTCVLQQTLPWATGKTDFSFDGKQVTFHMGKFPEPKQWFRFDNPKYKLDVYVLDLVKGQLTKVTDTGDGNSYFPTFRKNGTVGFIEAHHAADGKVYYSYSLADPSKGHKVQIEAMTDDCNCNVKELSQMIAIGALREELCSTLEKGTTLEHPATEILSLDQNKCEKMVKGYWNRLQDTVVAKVGNNTFGNPAKSQQIAQLIKELPVSAMLDACPKGIDKSGEVITNEANIKSAPVTPAKALTNTCASCHAGVHPSSGHPFDFSNPEQLSAANRTLMVEKIKQNIMPPGGIPDADLKKKLLDYLNSFH